MNGMNYSPHQTAIMDGTSSSLELNCTIQEYMYVVQAKKDPWLTNEILEQIIEKNRAVEKAKEHGQPENWKGAKAAS